MKLHFTKMQGCGNDYIYLDAMHQHIQNPEKLSICLSDRHFGIGGDGIVLLCPSQIADARMRIFNADGSEARMCGNAIRCVGKLFHDKGFTNKKQLEIETASGLRTVLLKEYGVKRASVCVDMAGYSMDPERIPVSLPLDRVCDYPLEAAGCLWPVTCVSMGNPHCVVFCDDPDSLNLAKIGPAFEHHPLFPDRINTEFVRVIGPRTLAMRVWERGSGETWACGTGACAAAVAAVEKNLMPRNEDICVRLRGGELMITVTEDTVWMEGEAVTVFEGEITVEDEA